MTKKSNALAGLPLAASEAVTHLGRYIRIARQRRRMTLDDMASRMFVTRKTLSRLESGDPGVSIGVLASALWVLGFEKDLMEIACPDKDTVGIHRELQRLPKRVRPEIPSGAGMDDLDF
ncbi:MAG: helix-turn-helix transcriptional regulator [Desulfosalsimonadaceae bacterium]